MAIPRSLPLSEALVGVLLSTRTGICRQILRNLSNNKFNKIRSDFLELSHATDIQRGRPGKANRCIFATSLRPHMKIKV